MRSRPSVTIYCQGAASRAVWYRKRWWCRGCGENVSAVSLDKLGRNDKVPSVTGSSARS